MSCMRSSSTSESMVHRCALLRTPRTPDQAAALAARVPDDPARLLGGIVERAAREVDDVGRLGAAAVAATLRAARRAPPPAPRPTTTTAPAPATRTQLRGRASLRAPTPRTRRRRARRGCRAYPRGAPRALRAARPAAWRRLTGASKSAAPLAIFPHPASLTNPRAAGWLGAGAPSSPRPSAERARDLAVVHAQREAADQRLPAVVGKLLHVLEDSPRSSRSSTSTSCCAAPTARPRRRSRSAASARGRGSSSRRGCGRCGSATAQRPPSDSRWRARSAVGLQEGLLREVLGIVMVAHPVVRVGVHSRRCCGRAARSARRAAPSPTQVREWPPAMETYRSGGRYSASGHRRGDPRATPAPRTSATWRASLVGGHDADRGAAVARRASPGATCHPSAT